VRQTETNDDVSSPSTEALPGEKTVLMDEPTLLRLRSESRKPPPPRSEMVTAQLPRPPRMPQG